MCFDAYRRNSYCRKMQRSSRKALVLIVLMASVQSSQGVTCTTCKDTIGGCTGGADCPLLKDPVSVRPSAVCWRVCVF